jgi:Domain of unknown function (DUF5666)
MNSNTGLCCVIAALAVVSACSDEEGVLSTGPTSVSSGGGSGGGNRIKLEAVVSDRSGACPALRFRLGGIPVGTTENTGFEMACDQVVNGAAIEVHGTAMANGALVAREVGADADARREPDFEAEGPVEQVSSANDCTNASGRGVNVLGLGFAIGSFTRIREIPNGCEGITTGTVVRARGRLTNPPSAPSLPLRATELEGDDD